MGGYAFVTLTAAQLEERRRQLDRAGFHAWLSPIILLVVIAIYRRLPLLLVPPAGPFLSSTADNLKRSPHQSKSQPAAVPPSEAKILLRRIRWALNTTYVREFGPVYVQLVGLVYFCWMLYLAFRATGNDYMHLTKSLGHVAISQLPMQYLLALKSPRSPITWATGLTHERLNAFHRLFGRMVHALLGAHAVLYLRFFISLDLLAKRIRDRDVQLGASAFWAFNFLAMLALPPVRRRLYHSVFYRSHVLLSASVIPMLFFHVPYTRVYVVQAAVFWVLGGILRRWGSETVEARCELIDETKTGTRTASTEKQQLVSVRFKVGASSPLAHAKPGQHVYIRRGGFMGPKNPFTIVSIRPVEHEDVDQKLPDQKAAQKKRTDVEVEVQLVLRNTGGTQTSYLAALAETGNQSGSENEGETRSSATATAVFQVEGPYGESGVYIPELLHGEEWSKLARIETSGTGSGTGTGTGHHVESTRSILLIAGGVGATYTLPIYMALLASQSTTDTNTTTTTVIATKSGSDSDSDGGKGKGTGIKMVWFVKTLAAAQWGIVVLTQAQERGDFQVALDLDIYITTNLEATDKDPGAGAGAGTQPKSNATLKSTATPSVPIRSGNGIRIHRLGYRPDVQSVINTALANPVIENVDSSNSSNNSSNGSGSGGGGGVSSARTATATATDDPRLHVVGNPIRRRVLTAAQDRQDQQQHQHQHHQYNLTTVFLCGPPNLARDVREILGRHISQGMEVTLFEEVFGFGGS